MPGWRCIAALIAGLTAVHAADPREIWDQAVKAKGGRERLHAVHSLAIYMKPAQTNLPGPPANWLCVFPDRYFEYDGQGNGEYPYLASNGVGLADCPRIIVVDGPSRRVAMDANGTPRVAWHLTSLEHDRMTLNQIVFLLESAWLQPRIVETKRNTVTVEAGGTTFRIYLDRSYLPERVLSLRAPGEKHYRAYDYRLQHYRDFQGVMLPVRVTRINGVVQWTWDVDYEVDAKYNPKLFARMPNLADGPEPWRLP
ncbi:MAG TPA: hypothetical protein VMG35_03885 [Bryobacteraceae bacterium]|nr:hypothetical protein [Bryobacteraceae bacterium]